MKKNTVRARLQQGEACVGTWLTLPDPLAAQLLARVGFDWLTVELEHAPTSFETAAQMFGVIAASGTVPLARVPWNTVENIKRVLDTGAWGVVVPLVNSRAEAEAVVAAARYAPRGQRSIGGQLHAATFETDPDHYYASANDEVLVVAMTEHIRAVEAADDILSVPGLDVAFIGPYDLHYSLGLRPAFESDHPAFTEAVRHVLRTARAQGLAAGIHVADLEMARRRLAEGFQFVAIASEAGFMLSKARELVAGLGRGAVGHVAKY